VLIVRDSPNCRNLKFKKLSKFVFEEKTGIFIDGENWFRIFFMF
jgi:hypothetical protein